MPFLKTVAAAASRGMLSDEWRKDAVAHRCLPAIIGNEGGSQSAGDDLRCVTSHLVPTFCLDIAAIGGVEVETAPKLRAGQSQKEVRQISCLYVAALLAGVISWIDFPSVEAGNIKETSFSPFTTFHVPT